MEVLVDKQCLSYYRHAVAYFFSLHFIQL